MSPECIPFNGHPKVVFQSAVSGGVKVFYVSQMQVISPHDWKGVEKAIMVLNIWLIIELSILDSIVLCEGIPFLELPILFS